MKKSQVVILIVLFAAVTALIWIGAFYGEDRNPDAVVQFPTRAPAATGAAGTAAPVHTPSGTAGETAATAAPETTPAPATPVVIPSVDRTALQGLSTEPEYWTANVRAEAVDGVKGYYEEYLDKLIQGYDYIFMKERKEGPKTMYLTFHDYPYEDSTGVVLDLLKEKGVKATFFISSDFLTANPDLVKRMRDEGHLIGTRGKNNGTVDMSTLSVDAFIAALTDMEHTYQSLFGESERMLYYRPDMFSTRDLAIANQMGYTVTFYTAARREWDLEAAADPGSLLRNTVDDGCVLLSTTSKTVASVLGPFIDFLLAQDIQLLRLDQ